MKFTTTITGTEKEGIKELNVYQDGVSFVHKEFKDTKEEELKIGKVMAIFYALNYVQGINDAVGSYQNKNFLVNRIVDVLGFKWGN